MKALPPPVLYVQWERAAQPLLPPAVLYGTSNGSQLLSRSSRPLYCLSNGSGRNRRRQAGCRRGGEGGGGGRRAPRGPQGPLQPPRTRGSGRSRTRGRLFDQHLFFNWPRAPWGAQTAPPLIKTIRNTSTIKD